MTTAGAAVAATVRGAAGVPVDPTADEARRWLVRELAKAEYAAARPTWFDKLVGAISDWFRSLSVSGSGTPQFVGIVVVLSLVVIALVVAFLVFGLPRLRRRSTITGELFGQDDSRGSAALRTAAERLAIAGNYGDAIAEMFRAIARGLAERAILSTTPGTTATSFAARAADEFPGQRGQLAAAADAFNDVRYLGREGTAEAFGAVASLERELRAARPRLAEGDDTGAGK